VDSNSINPGSAGIESPRLEIQLVRELEFAHANGIAPAAVPHAAAYQWANACHDLFESGRIDVTGYAAACLHARYPEIPYLAKLAALFDAVPYDAPAPITFTDDPAAEVQIVRRPGAEKVMLCFCAAEGTLGMPLNFVHQWLGRLPVSLVYIKDFQNLSGGAGFPTLGPDRDSAVVALRRIVSEIDGKIVYSFGVSLGGYAALYYGLKLEAASVLSLCGAADYTPQFVSTIGPMPKAYLDLRERAPDYLKSLRDSCIASTDRTRVLWVYSARFPRDRMQAERIAGLPNVELIAVDYGQHNVIDPLIRRGEFSPLLNRFLAIEPLMTRSGENHHRPISSERQLDPVKS
jgi:hypothetical protein